MKDYETKPFFEMLGWQGGTIHQVSDEIGVPVEVLLYGKPSSTLGSNCDYMKGQYAFSTCSKEWVRERLLPMYKGNADFWLGYKIAYMIDCG